jgi:transcriptional regulator with XRE-family HTH domain
MTTTALADKIGISQAQVSRLEMGEQGFRSDVVGRMAKALKVPAFRFFMTDAEWKRWLKRK